MTNNAYPKTNGDGLLYSILWQYIQCETSELHIYIRSKNFSHSPLQAKMAAIDVQYL
jgi:hypothetical protein